MFGIWFFWKLAIFPFELEFFPIALVRVSHIIGEHWLGVTGMVFDANTCSGKRSIGAYHELMGVKGQCTVCVCKHCYVETACKWWVVLCSNK